MKSDTTGTVAEDTLKNVNVNDFELMYQGALTNLANPASGIVLREREAWKTPEGRWARVYGFGDGHTEVHVSNTPENTGWEAAHAVEHQEGVKAGL